MSKNTSLLLIFWNVVLTALVVYGLTRGTSTTGSATNTATSSDSTGVVLLPSDSAMDRSALANARIAYFELDSLQNGLDLIKEQRALYQGEYKRLETKVMNRQREAQAEADALMRKDQTYSTKAEQEADMARLQQLDSELKQMAAESGEAMENLEMRIMNDMTMALKDFLTEYNKTAKFDYVIMMQPGGQVWPGNPGLDISRDMIVGMNAKHAAKKTEKASAKKPG